MTSPRRLLLLLLAVLFAGTLADPAAAKVYRYRDAQGNLHYADDPGRVPKQYQDSVEPIDLGGEDDTGVIDAILDAFRGGDGGPARSGGGNVQRMDDREDGPSYGDGDDAGGGDGGGGSGSGGSGGSGGSVGSGRSGGATGAGGGASGNGGPADPSSGGGVQSPNGSGNGGGNLNIRVGNGQGSAGEGGAKEAPDIGPKLKAMAERLSDFPWLQKLVLGLIASMLSLFLFAILLFLFLAFIAASIWGWSAKEPLKLRKWGWRMGSLFVLAGVFALTIPPTYGAFTDTYDALVEMSERS